MRDAHRALVVHLLLVLILNQTLHQVACVDLVVSDVLHTRARTRTGQTRLVQQTLVEKPLTHVAVALDDRLAGSDQQRVDLDVLQETARQEVESQKPQRRGG